MTAQEILSQLQSLDVRIWVEEGKLRVNAPKGLLTPALRERINAHREELIRFLRASDEDASLSALKLVHAPRAQVLLPSFMQEGLWYLSQLAADIPVYNISAGLGFSEAVVVPQLERSIAETTRRHEVLRTNFPQVDGKLVLHIAEPAPFSLPTVDLRALPDEERVARLKDLLTQEMRRPFDLAQDHLLRATLYRLSEELYFLWCVVHHSVSDGWSLRILTHDIRETYNAFVQGRPCPLPDLPYQHVDFAWSQRQWRLEPLFQQQLDYWTRQLAGPLPTLDLPTDRRRPAVQSFHGDAIRFEVPAEMLAALKALARGANATLYMVILAAFNALLYRYSSQNDIVIGVPVANRNRVEAEKVIGPFVNTLVMRTQLAGEMTFRELLAHVRRTSLDALANQDVPFEVLVDRLHPVRDASR
jgi:hypothetical protein